MKLKDENNVLLLLNVLLKTLKHFKYVLLFRKGYTITLEEVQTSIQANKFQNCQESKTKDNWLSLNVLHTNNKRKVEERKKTKHSSNNRVEKGYECYNFNKRSHYKKDCPKIQRNERGRNSNFKENLWMLLFCLAIMSIQEC